MATLAESKDPIEIPVLPSVTVKDFVPYLTKNIDIPFGTLLGPFKKLEIELHKFRARSLVTESDEEKSKYIMVLKDEERKQDGSPTVVGFFEDFQQNFNLFS
ncbi:hypothetical protein LZ554_006318 [Drepanopeziza brunnea f. sp. 'monogermtubi']|nr:hypothetical protein LZ554_006318 [Drepanopeziza brunnea f. sp. 'monogermtubi']